ncbi:hypothetical protein AUK22_05375 [bacterium CG2_30_54_10]|nr:MAG: hypothetical protein AUK22_05375 [bacterium CG2_30_54_10]
MEKNKGKSAENHPHERCFGRMVGDLPARPGQHFGHRVDRTLLPAFSFRKNPAAVIAKRSGGQIAGRALRTRQEKQATASCAFGRNFVVYRAATLTIDHVQCLLSSK